MKLFISMKTPDCVDYAVKEAIKQERDEFESEADKESFDEETDGGAGAREVCKKWFRYGECVTLEVDTDAKTCTVLEAE